MADISGIRSRLVPAVNIPTPPAGSMHLFFDSADSVAKLKDSSGVLNTLVTASTITGTTLASNVVNSSLTSVGTLTSGVWNANTIGISYGGTGQTTANSALNALLPAQGGNSGKFLTTNGTNTSWASILGGVIYRGTWNANTNSPTLGSSGAGGSQGDYYVVNVAGSTLIDGISSWEISDWIIHNGTVWEKVDHTDTVTTLTGDVTGSGLGSFATSIASNVVTNAKLAQVSTSTIKGRITAGTGNVEDLTSANVLTILGISGTRVIKSGIVAGGSFAGNPKTANVTFGTAFSSTNYTVFLMSTNNRTFTYSAKTTAGFTINANANPALSGEVCWFAIDVAESVE